MLRCYSADTVWGTLTEGPNEMIVCGALRRRLIVCGAPQRRLIVITSITVHQNHTVDIENDSKTTHPPPQKKTHRQ